MHKFFCNYNTLTERYELSQNKNNIFNPRINTLEESSLMSKIQNSIQNLYDLIVQIKEMTKEDEKLNLIDENELLISNLYYSFFASPLELPEKEHDKHELKALLTMAIEETNNLEKLVNIPEYNRLVKIISNNFQILLNDIA